MIGSVLSGLVLGTLITLVSCGSTTSLSGTREEAYLSLAATLYGQGESLTAMKVYLNSYAPRDPATALLQLAEKYEQSSDRKKQQQVRDLKRLGEALKMGRDPEAGALPASSPVTAAQPIVSNPSASPQVLASSPPNPNPLAQAQPAPSPTPVQSTTPTPISNKGVARPSGGNGAIMREQPTTKSAWIASLPNGAAVEILKVVDGEAVDSAEPRWYLVKAGNKTGYVYFKLIAAE